MPGCPRLAVDAATDRLTAMKIRELLRRWFGRTPAPEPVAAVALDSPAWGRILSMLNPPDTRGEYQLPTVLPGVRPEKLPTPETGLKLALDTGYAETLATDEAPAAWGFPGGQGSVIGPGVAFLGFPYLAELQQITEYRTPSESLANEMTRRWMRLKNKGKGDLESKLHDITERMEQLKVRDLFREAALKTEQFGRAHIMVNVKSQDDDVSRQLPLTKIEKGTLLGFACIEPYWLTPYSWNSTQPERPDFYKPQSWFVLGKKTHGTRLLTFIFREVPDLLKPAYDFAGISMTQLMMPYVNRWLRSAKSVNDLINIFSIVNLSTDLSALMKAGLNSDQGLIARIQGFTQARDNRGMMITNKSTEELGMQNVPLGTLDKLQAQAQEHMATPARMPLIEFFGITPAGLNASSEGEFQARNKYVKGMQELGYSRHLERVLHLVQMDLFGSVDDDVTFEWLSLYEPSGKELGEIRKADADRDAVFITNGVVSPEEVRDKLQMDPESGYDGLEGDAPEPPMEAEHALGEESADNAHERGEESADNTHARQLEQQKNEPPPAKK